MDIRSVQSVPVPERGKVGGTKAQWRSWRFSSRGNDSLITLCIPPRFYPW